MRLRRVFSRSGDVGLLDFEIAKLVARVRLAWFSLVMTPTKVSPFFVMMFSAQKLGSTSRFGSMM